MPAAIMGHRFIPSRMRLWHSRIRNTSLTNEREKGREHEQRRTEKR